jgi:NodT family efflux transporter outer membrane factor (OMF) lipoprotein
MMALLSIQRGLFRIAVTMSVTAAVCIGCVGGEPHPPAPPESAPTYSSPDEAAAPRVDPAQSVVEQTLAPAESVPGRWWTLFQSPQLDRLVDEAAAGSPTLEAARTRLLAEQETLRAARGALFPDLTLNAGITREKESAASFGLPPNSLPLPANFNLYQLGLNGNYDVDLSGRIRQHIAQQAAFSVLQQRQREMAYLTVTGNTVSMAIQLAVGTAQLHAVAGIVQIDEETVRLVRNESEVGTVPESDVVIASSQLAADQTLQPGIEQQLSVARHALAVLLGHAPSEWSAPDLQLSQLTLPTRLPLTLPSALVHQRPDILVAEAQLRIAGAQVGLATADLYPRITLGAGVTAESLRLRDLFDPAGLVWSIAAGLAQPVFDAGMRRAQRRAALAEFKASAADYQQTVLQSFQQVADILQAIEHNAELAAAQQRALEAASRSVTLQRANYERGGAGLLDLLDAQRQYQQALLGDVRVEGQRYQDTAQLLVALGGGGLPAKPAARTAR